MKDYLLNLWHDFYYKMPIPGGEEFALTCKQAVECIDLQEPPATWTAWFRLRLHISLCQACRYYFQASHILGKAVRQMVRTSDPVDVEKLNRDLLAKYRRSGAR